MDDNEIQNSSYQEVAPQEQSQGHEQPDQYIESKEDRNERNWSEMRRQKKQLEEELMSQRQMIERLMVQSTPKEVDEFDSISDDDFIPKGQVNRLVEKRAAKIAQEIAQRETEKFFKHQEQSKFLDKLNRQYSDFNEIVNADTLAVLEKHDPELAESIAELKDPYKIGLQSYKYIKALGLQDKVPQQRRNREIEQKIEKNSKTVQSPQAFDKRPVAQAFKMTQSEKTALFNEMNQYASMVGHSY